MKKYSFSPMDARYKVSIHSESPEGSTKQAHNSDTIYWFFVEC